MTAIWIVLELLNVLGLSQPRSEGVSKKKKEILQGRPAPVWDICGGVALQGHAGVTFQPLGRGSQSCCQRIPFVLSQIPPAGVGAEGGSAASSCNLLPGSHISIFHVGTKGAEQFLGAHLKAGAGCSQLFRMFSLQGEGEQQHPWRVYGSDVF